MVHNAVEDNGDVPAMPALPDVIVGAAGLTVTLAK
jgi:hypothetical protein